MTLQQLEYILAVDTYRHFIRAAESCFVTQPTLSMMVQKLEDELGIRIFDRSKQPVVPTEAGMLVIEQARVILREASRLEELANSQKTAVAGELRLGVIPTLAPYLIPAFVPAFSATYPDVRLFIHELTTEHLLKQLKQSKLDVALMATPTGDKELLERPLFVEEFVVYAPGVETIMAKKYLMAGDIDPQKLMLLEEGHCVRSQIVNLCELRKKDSFVNNVCYEAGSLETLKKMARASAGITILPQLAILDFDEDEMECVRFFKEPAPVREISLVTHRAYVKERLLDVLTDCILQNLPISVSAQKQVKVMKPV